MRDMHIFVLWSHQFGSIRQRQRDTTLPTTKVSVENIDHCYLTPICNKIVISESHTKRLIENVITDVYIDPFLHI